MAQVLRDVQCGFALACALGGVRVAQRMKRFAFDTRQHLADRRLRQRSRFRRLLDLFELALFDYLLRFLLGSGPRGHALGSERGPVGRVVNTTMSFLKFHGNGDLVWGFFFAEQPESDASRSRRSKLMAPPSRRQATEAVLLL
jgi:hypothetical protein